MIHVATADASVQFINGAKVATAAHRCKAITWRPKKYTQMQTSGVRYAVEAGSNQIDVDLSSEPS